MLPTIENREAPVRQEQELMWRTAVHEAAHAVCANWFDQYSLRSAARCRG
jgi:hypothetical protein